LDYQRLLDLHFTLGGLGGGIAKNKKDYLKIIKSGLHESPVSQV
jgi:carbamoyl-phosphate synthase large subunit